MRYFCYIVLFLPLSAWAQDVVFSQYTNALSAINPACAEQNETRARVHSLYRNQWNSVTNNPYQSFFLSGDYSIKNGAFFVGIAILGDRAGDAQLFSKQAAVNFGVKIQFSEKSYCNLGLQPSFLQRSIDLSSAVWNSQFDGKHFDQSLSSGEYYAAASANNFDIASGLSWTYVKSNNKLFTIGLAAFHILKPNYSFYAVSEVIPLRWTAHASAMLAMKNNKYVLKPAFLYVHQGAYQQCNLGAKFSFPIGIESRYTNFKKTSDVVAGMFYRWSDAVVLLIGFDFRRQYMLAFSYDIAVDNFVANNKWRGGSEISFRWNITTVKKE